MTFTDELRDAAGEQWHRVISHKFCHELAADTIHPTVLRRYLIQDYRFLDAFLVMLASIVVQARTLADRLPACQFLGVVTSDENRYFERAFQALGVSEQERHDTPDAQCTIDFCRLMRTVATQGSLGEKLAVICVCEWSYQSWANLVKEQAQRNDFCKYEWIDLHSGTAFDDVVAYLRALLDKEAQYMEDKEKELCRQRFLHAIQLEEDFFENAYAAV